MCIMNLGSTLRACDLPKTLDYIPWTPLCSHSTSGLPWSFKSFGPNASNVNATLKFDLVVAQIMI